MTGLQENIKKFRSDLPKADDSKLVDCEKFVETIVLLKQLDWDSEVRQYIAEWPNRLYNNKTLKLIKTLDLTGFMNLTDENRSLTKMNKDCWISRFQKYLARCVRVNLMVDKKVSPVLRLTLLKLICET